MVQILSNLEVILLYIVNEKPSYAYEINKAIDSRNIRMWVRVGLASIYQVLRRLEKKKLVYSQEEKEGKMPDRIRYYITESGKSALKEASKRLLSGIEWYYLDLNVGLEASDALTPREKAESLINRLNKVKSNIKRMKEIVAYDSDVRFKKKALIKNLIYMRESEEAYLQEVLRDMSIGIYDNVRDLKSGFLNGM
ncbi:PadR family transcriptional regulator [Pelotomaculum schinkii]|nr:PadR family transcriptional regulator [Pelotomaculum schinkii]